MLYVVGRCPPLAGVGGGIKNNLSLLIECLKMLLDARYKC